MISKGKKGKRI